MGRSTKAFTMKHTGRQVRWATAALTVGGMVLAWSSPADAAEAPVGLGTAASYSVLAGTTVTNTGPSKLSGDLGVSPGTAITGFGTGNGTAAGATHAGDAAALQAQKDLVTAYDDAAGRAPTALVAGDLVGKTLTAGVYKSTDSLALSGTLTLDAQGDPNAVFIFQVASTLITASSSRVSVLNGAQACNVYWQVGSSATLGTTSTFVGTIMALTSISVTTGTTVAGRALARNGAVTLDNNTFTPANCAATPPPIPTTTTLTTAPNPATTGSTVTLTATVTGESESPITTGTVDFTDQAGTVLGTATLDQTGHATLSVPASSETIIAKYNGHLSLTTSSSAPIVLNTTPAPIPVTTTGSTAPVTTTTSPTPVTPTEAAATLSSDTQTLAATGVQQIPGLATGAAVLILTGLTCLWATRSPRRRRRH
ncbi:MAG: ice-binding family protein [Antricoccus sp.]